MTARNTFLACLLVCLLAWMATGCSLLTKGGPYPWEYRSECYPDSVSSEPLKLIVQLNDTIFSESECAYAECLRSAWPPEGDTCKVGGEVVLSGDTVVSVPILIAAVQNTSPNTLQLPGPYCEAAATHLGFNGETVLLLEIEGIGEAEYEISQNFTICGVRAPFTGIYAERYFAAVGAGDVLVIPKPIDVMGTARIARFSPGTYWLRLGYRSYICDSTIPNEWIGEVWSDTLRFRVVAD